MSQSSCTLLPDGRKVDDLKVFELKKELELRGLSRAGVKKDLCTRLSDALDSEINLSSNLNEQQGGLIPGVAHTVSDTALQNVEDTLEIDALDSEEDVTDSISNTVIYVPDENENALSNVLPSDLVRSPNVDAAIGQKENTEKSEFVDPQSNLEDVKQVNDQHPINRRRQWGTRNNDVTTPSLSTESLEKLVPSKIRSIPPEDLNSSELQTNEQNDKPCLYETHPPENQIMGAVNSDRDIEIEVDAVVGSIDMEDSTDLNPAMSSTSLPSINNKPNVAPTKRERSSSHTSKQFKERTVVKSDTVSGAHVSTDASKGVSKKSSPTKRKGPKETKAVGYLVEQPERIEASQPATHVPTSIVHIRFLVRPFTADQLRQMISTHYGVVLDLWLDKIKSTSLVKMESIEVAKKCREGLDGSRWPSMNPHVLRCEFASEDLFEWMKINGDSLDVQPPKHLFTLEKLVDVPKTAEPLPQSSRDSSSDLRHKLDISSNDGKITEKKAKMPDLKELSLTLPIIKPKEDEPAELLNNLFRKTAATPSIYWLPLTAEQAKQRDTPLEQKQKVQTKRSSDDLHFHASSGPTRVVSEPGKKAPRSPFTNAHLSPTRKQPSPDRLLKGKLEEPKRQLISKSDDTKVTPVIPATTNSAKSVSINSKSEAHQPSDDSLSKSVRSSSDKNNAHDKQSVKTDSYRKSTNDSKSIRSNDSIRKADQSRLKSAPKRRLSSRSSSGTSSGSSPGRNSGRSRQPRGLPPTTTSTSNVSSRSDRSRSRDKKQVVPTDRSIRKRYSSRSPSVSPFSKQDSKINRLNDGQSKLESRLPSGRRESPHSRTSAQSRRRSSSRDRYRSHH